MADVFLWIACLAVAGFLVFAAGAGFGSGVVRAEAIQRGYALHCPQTGDFAWKGECDE